MLVIAHGSSGGLRLPTRFAIARGRAHDVLVALERAGVSLAAARLASRLGNPDPFHLRAALVDVPGDAQVEGCGGEELDRDGVIASLVAAIDADVATEADPMLTGLLAFHTPGPRLRSVVPRVALRGLRWGSHGALHAEEPPPASLGAVDRWSTSAIGDHEAATVRAILALPDGSVALGSDYGLTLARQGAFRPFPWPAGARREARRVETMAHHAGELVIGTSQALFVMDARGNVRSTRHPADDEGGQDELLTLFSTGGRLLQGWRTRLLGGHGPRDVLAMVQDPSGTVYAGTRSGEVVVVDGTPEGGSPACIAQLGGERRRPVRHLAFARNALWAAAAGACHRFDGAAWVTVADVEPTAMNVDRAGRLWMIADGALWSVEGPLGQESWLPWDVPVDRPWCLAAAEDALWVGGHGQLARIALDP